MPRFFPTGGCRAAFECGKEYVIAGGNVDKVDEALTFCETRQEEAFFLMGCAEEQRDLEEMFA